MSFDSMDDPSICFRLLLLNSGSCFSFITPLLLNMLDKIPDSIEEVLPIHWSPNIFVFDFTASLVKSDVMSISLMLLILPICKLSDFHVPNLKVVPLIILTIFPLYIIWFILLLLALIENLESVFLPIL